MYADHLERIQAAATRDGLGELKRAREEFHELTGPFEDGEPWFELRMTMFLDWYLLDRRGADGLTPAERFLDEASGDLSPQERSDYESLTVTLRSIFCVEEQRADRLTLDDLAGGARWVAQCTIPTVGLARGSIFGSRLALFRGSLVVGRGTVLHPTEAHEPIRKIMEKARRDCIPARDIVDHLDKMRLKLDRYASIRVQHVYQYPGKTRL
jgi:hypothetical protein